MRVLVVTNMYPTEERPFWGTFVRDQVESLRAEGIEVELEVEENRIVIRSSQSSRQGWEEQFKKMTEEGDDVLLDGDVKLSSWDEVDWEW